MNVRKGQKYRRRCDDYVFVVKNVSRVAKGAHLQCVDATHVFGWFTFDAIALSFVKETQR